MHILLVDDHELVRDSIAGFIRRVTGFLVDSVGDLPSALDAVEINGPFDLVLLDYQMPGMSGLDGLPDMVARQQGKLVAILSGSMPASLVEEVFRSGAAGYLPKTMTTNALIQALRLILAGEKICPAQLHTASVSGHTVFGLADAFTARDGCSAPSMPWFDKQRDRQAAWRAGDACKSLRKIDLQQG